MEGLLLLASITVARFLAPLVALRWPLWAVAGAVLLDALDWELLSRYPQLSSTLYQPWDKAVDVYTATIWLVYIWNAWKNRAIAKVATVAYLVRLGGVLVYEATAVRALLFVFPNIFDSLFMVAVVGEHLLKVSPSQIQGRRLGVLVTGVAALKLLHEYFIHIAQTYPWQWQGWSIPLGSEDVTRYGSMLLWSILFILLHLGALGYASRLRSSTSGGAV